LYLRFYFVSCKNFQHLACVADLKSVRSKLANSQYLDSEQFADDVRKILSQSNPDANKSAPSAFQIVLDEFENLWTAVFLRGGPTPTEILEENVEEEMDRELSAHFKKIKECCITARNVIEQCSLAARFLLSLKARRRRAKQCGEPLPPVPKLALKPTTFTRLEFVTSETEAAQSAPLEASFENKQSFKNDGRRHLFPEKVVEILPLGNENPVSDSNDVEASNYINWRDNIWI
uniref:Mediator of RNA polymerase II transcription subunit 4 n=1 Tax=Angiostrongylus costaricensis TaxID=334426 RepID=A0A0R3PGW4_ANGCS